MELEEFQAKVSNFVSLGFLNFCWIKVVNRRDRIDLTWKNDNTFLEILLFKVYILCFFIELITWSYWNKIHQGALSFQKKMYVYTQARINIVCLLKVDSGLIPGSVFFLSQTLLAKPDKLLLIMYSELCAHQLINLLSPTKHSVKFYVALYNDMSLYNKVCSCFVLN